MKKLVAFFVMLLAMMVASGCYAAEEYGYEQLAGLENGLAQQSFYRELQNVVETFGYGDTDAQDDLEIAFYSVEETGLTADEMAQAYVSLLADHPEYYWISIETVTEYSNALRLATMPECQTAAQRKEISAAIEKKSEALLAVIKKKLTETDGTVIDIAAVTHDVLVVNLEYDLSAPMGHTIAGALWGGLGVCDGYAKAYQYLLGKQGVFSRWYWVMQANLMHGTTSARRMETISLWTQLGTIPVSTR